MVTREQVNAAHDAYNAAVRQVQDVARTICTDPDYRKHKFQADHELERARRRYVDLDVAYDRRVYEPNPWK